ncbi:MAG: hypothetical protein ACK55I_39550 [bacterium]
MKQMGRTEAPDRSPRTEVRHLFREVCRVSAVPSPPGDRIRSPAPRAADPAGACLRPRHRGL